jgi:lipid-A-disaccharide synthase
MTASLRVYLIAGEASGDQLGARLMAGLKSATNVKFYGIGGPLMAREGLRSLFDMSELSVMGLSEVLPNLRHLLARRTQAAQDILATRPDVVITIDSPDFCLRVLKAVKAESPRVKTIHYVAPSVWAWRPKRAAKMARVVDHVLALLPFEPPYMEAAGMSCDFVGHPVVALPVSSAHDRATFRAQHDIAPDAPLLCLLPGSRKGEIARHAEVFSDCARALRSANNGLRIVLPAPEQIEEDVREAFGDLAIVLSGSERDKHTAFGASDVALAASGTVSLELARQSTPMVIGYKMAPLTEFLVKRLVKLKSATLVNIVTQTQAVPEFLFGNFTAEKITPAVQAILDDPNAAQAQRAAAAQTMTALGADGPDPGERAAQSVLAYLER